MRFSCSALKIASAPSVPILFPYQILRLNSFSTLRSTTGYLSSMVLPSNFVPSMPMPQLPTLSRWFSNRV